MTAVPTPCLDCGAELGPWEQWPDPRCLKCETPLEVSDWAEVSRVLERSTAPLYVWDIRRMQSPSRFLRPSEVRVREILSGKRFCWGGRSMYGLYRHDLLPGARDLGTVAGAVIHVGGEYMTAADVHFAMRHIGYRHAAVSVNSALGRVWGTGMFTAFHDGTYLGHPDSEAEQRVIAGALGFPRREAAFHAVIARLTGQVAEARVERVRRRGY